MIKIKTVFDFKFKYHESDIKQALRENFISNKRLVIDLLISLLLISISLYLIISYKTTVYYSFLLFIGVLFIVIIFLRMVIIPGIIYRRTPKYHQEYYLEFNEDKILFVLGNNRSEFEWSYYIDIRETNGFIYLYYAKKAYSIIPKRIFVDKKTEVEFVQFVKKKLNK
ncbi:YcxB family protein [Paenibacillus sp. BC26]|uniref:YcxB family protein n=1 Tax=Paenibacillus sp. BC26 TaxID=1881032 RepID=UPI0035284CE4